MFGMGCFADADGEDGMLVIDFSLQSDGIAQVCMGGFVEGLSRRILGWIDIIFPVNICLSIFDETSLYSLIS